jgi:alpha-glucosidase (family GH31 glycosyl hydrolase)
MLQESTQYGLKNHLKASKIEALSQGLYRVDLENKKNSQISFLFIALLAPKILRIFYSDKNHFEYHQPNPFIERLEQDTAFDKWYDDSEAFWLLSQEFKIQIIKQKLALNIFDSKHNLISADETELGYYKDHSKTVLCYKRYENLEQPPLIYGLGDKTGSINRWGKRLRNAPIDALGYDSSNTDPLYKDIPFFIHLDPRSQKAHGIFFDNFYSIKLSFLRFTFFFHILFLFNYSIFIMNIQSDDDHHHQIDDLESLS